MLVQVAFVLIRLLARVTAEINFVGTINLGMFFKAWCFHRYWALQFISRFDILIMNVLDVSYQTSFVFVSLVT